MHYVDSEQFTSVAWSIEQLNIIFFSGEKGSLEVWDITKRKSEPIQSQNISGRAINGEFFKDILNSQVLFMLLSLSKLFVRTKRKSPRATTATTSPLVTTQAPLD